MKNTYLSIIVIAAGMAMIGCDSGNSGAGTTCAQNPTMQGCSLQAAALAAAQVPGAPGPNAQALAGTNPVLKQIPLNTGPNNTVVAPPTLINPTTGLPYNGQQDAALRSKAAQISAALAAGNNDPNSPYYQPPKTTAAEVRSPSSVSAPPAVDSSIASETSSMEGAGEATR